MIYVGPTWHELMHVGNWTTPFSTTNAYSSKLDRVPNLRGVFFENICWNHHVGISQCFFVTTIVSTTTLSPAFSVLPTLRDLHVWPCIFAGGACVGFCWAVAGGHQRGKHNGVLHKQHQWHTKPNKNSVLLLFVVFFSEALNQILKSENNSRLCNSSLITVIPLCWTPGHFQMELREG